MTGTTYELWHAASGNFLEDFESEGEALAAVREYLDANGPEMVCDLALGAVPSTGLTGGAGTPPFLQGAELLARVEALASQPGVPDRGSRSRVERSRQPATGPGSNEPTPPEQAARKAVG
jgi:hypothetical protein